MPSRILVVNPNSTEAVTRDIDRALDVLRLPGGPEIVCCTLAEGPPVIESQHDVEQAVLPLCRLVESETESTDAFVIACFSDPGLYALREATSRPVFGISQAGLATALCLGDGVGIIAILARSVRRHARYFRSLGFAVRIVGERSLEMGVRELSSQKRAFSRMLKVGTMLRDKDGADVLVLGCAGMAVHRARLEAALGIPVVDPTQAAVGIALASLRVKFGSSGAKEVSSETPPPVRAGRSRAAVSPRAPRAGPD
jgi:allantoin racemase